MSGHEVPPVDPLTPREIAMLCDHGWVDAADSLTVSYTHLTLPTTPYV